MLGTIGPIVVLHVELLGGDAASFDIADAASTGAWLGRVGVIDDERLGGQVLRRVSLDVVTVELHLHTFCCVEGDCVRFGTPSTVVARRLGDCGVTTVGATASVGDLVLGRHLTVEFEHHALDRVLHDRCAERVQKRDVGDAVGIVLAEQVLPEESSLEPAATLHLCKRVRDSRLSCVLIGLDRLLRLLLRVVGRRTIACAGGDRESDQNRHDGDLDLRAVRAERAGHADLLSQCLSTCSLPAGSRSR